MHDVGSPSSVDLVIALIAHKNVVLLVPVQTGRQGAQKTRIQNIPGFVRVRLAFIELHFERAFKARIDPRHIGDVFRQELPDQRDAGRVCPDHLGPSLRHILAPHPAGSFAPAAPISVVAVDNRNRIFLLKTSFFGQLFNPALYFVGRTPEPGVKRSLRRRCEFHLKTVAQSPCVELRADPMIVHQVKDFFEPGIALVIVVREIGRRSFHGKLQRVQRLTLQGPPADRTVPVSAAGHDERRSAIGHPVGDDRLVSAKSCTRHIGQVKVEDIVGAQQLLIGHIIRGNQADCAAVRRPIGNMLAIVSAQNSAKITQIATDQRRIRIGDVV